MDKSAFPEIDLDKIKEQLSGAVDSPWFIPGAAAGLGMGVGALTARRRAGESSKERALRTIQNALLGGLIGGAGGGAGQLALQHLRVAGGQNPDGSSSSSAAQGKWYTNRLSRLGYAAAARSAFLPFTRNNQLNNFKRLVGMPSGPKAGYTIAPFLDPSSGNNIRMVGIDPATSASRQREALRVITDRIKSILVSPDQSATSKLISAIRGQSNLTGRGQYGDTAVRRQLAALGLSPRRFRPLRAAHRLINPVSAYSVAPGWRGLTSRGLGSATGLAAMIAAYNAPEVTQGAMKAFAKPEQESNYSMFAPGVAPAETASPAEKPSWIQKLLEPLTKPV